MDMHVIDDPLRDRIEHRRAIERRIAHLLDRGERILWAGRSSTTAYLAGHIPLTLFTGLFAWATTGSLVSALWRMDLGAIGLGQAVFGAVSIIMVAATVRSIWRDTDVSWAITDRRVHRMSHGRTITTDIRTIASIETRSRTGGRGDVIVSMPEYVDRSGDRQRPSVAMLDVDDMNAARAAAATASSPDL